MTIRRKLAVLLGGLAAIAVLVAGVALFITLRWQTTADDIASHYNRSLILQGVRADIFAALKEVDDALTGDAADAQRDFERNVAPTAENLKRWTALAHDDAERREVGEVQGAFERLVTDAERVFALMLDGRREEAVRLVDEDLDVRGYAAFREITERAVAADGERRRQIIRDTDALRRTAQIMIAVVFLATLSLTLLLAAFVAQDLFRPLGEVRAALIAMGRGDLDRRLDLRADDEIGAIGAAFNKAAETIARRQRTDADAGGERSENWRDRPTRATLHRLVGQLRDRVAAVRAGEDPVGAVAAAAGLADAIARITEVGFPLDLDLETVDPNQLAHDVLARFGGVLAERGISCEVVLGDAVGAISVDRPKLKAAIVEVVRNALDAMPERGGRLGLRVSTDAEGSQIRSEVADTGRGMDAAQIERILSFDPLAVTRTPRVGLATSRAVAERHGGTLKVFSRIDHGTVVRISLPTGH